MQMPSAWRLSPHQVVPVGVVNHPPLLHHGGALPLGVFDGLNNPHQGDVTAGGQAEHQHTETGFSRTTLQSRGAIWKLAHK